MISNGSHFANAGKMLMSLKIKLLHIISEKTDSLISIKGNVKDIDLLSEEDSVKMFAMDFEEFRNFFAADVEIAYIPAYMAMYLLFFFLPHLPFGDSYKSYISSKLYLLFF